MSQFPPPEPFQPPQSFPHAYPVFPPPRPGVVGGLAVTGIVLGSLGLLCNGLGLISELTLMTLGHNPFAPNAPVMHDPAINGFGVVSVVVSLILSGALLTFSIGALNLKASAHTGLMRWSLFTLVWATVVLVVQILWVMPATADFFLKNPPPGSRGIPQGMAGSIKVLQTGGAVFVWILWCTMPVLFLLLWRTPRVLAAFGKVSTPPAHPAGPFPS
jgi:hypothetical protein